MSTDGARARLAEIRARLEAATPGPWRLGYDGDHPVIENDQAHGVLAFLPQRDGDLDLIAHAPGDMAWLLGELEACMRAREILK